jgi:hypothetical protein
MKIVLSLLISLLAGCTPSPMDKAKQNFACKDKGGVYEYTITNKVSCMNGGYVTNWGDVTLTIDYYPKEGNKK